MNTASLASSAGIGLRGPHIKEVFDTLPALAWLEVHSENYFVAGGSSLTALSKIREHYPISLHGVGMSLGSVDGLNEHHLNQLQVLEARIQPAAVSEHLCWSGIDGQSFNDLLPLPYSHAALNQVCANVHQLQDTLKRSILVENVSSYLRFVPEEMPEWLFMAELAQRTGCSLLLDINNIYVSAMNHQFDANEYLAGIPANAVAEIHLAGFEEIDGLWIDTHSRPVHAAVWDLYSKALQKFGAIATLIEWDQDLPSLDLLSAEAEKAQTYLDAMRNVALKPHVVAA